MTSCTDSDSKPFSWINDSRAARSTCCVRSTRRSSLFAATAPHFPNNRAQRVRLLTNGWMVIGFGMKGLWTAVLPVFAGTLLSSVSTAFPKPAIGAYGFEMTGIGMFLGSLFVAYYAIEMMPGRRLRTWLTTAAVT